MPEAMVDRDLEDGGSLPPALFAIAQGIADRRYHLTSPVYHLVLNGRFLGLVNVHGYVAAPPSATANEVQACEWCSRPATAGVAPAGFLRVPVADLMWQYAMAVDEDLLPERYHRLPIHFARPPHVPVPLITALHLETLKRLAERPRRIDELRAALAVHPQELLCVLASLYFAGCITTQASKAALRPGRSAADAISGFGSDAATDAEEAGSARAPRRRWSWRI